MHRSFSNSQSFINMQYCLTFQTRPPIILIPKNITYYFVNSKRRFFLYLKHKHDIQTVIKIFQRAQANPSTIPHFPRENSYVNNVNPDTVPKFYQRRSMFPDRQQYEQLVYHCNFKIRRKDLRRNLRYGTQLRQTKMKIQENYKQKAEQQSQNIPDKNNKIVEQKQNQKILQAALPFRAEPIFSSFSIQKLLPQTIDLQQTQPQYVADFGQIKIKNQKVLGIINNPEIIKALFRAQKRKPVRK